MSNRTFIEKWRDISLRLAQISAYECPASAAIVPKDLDSSLQQLTLLYAKYILVIQELVKTHDQILHPQKRRLIRETLTAALARFLEVKALLSSSEFSDFPEILPVLHDLKLTPDELCLPIPSYFLEERIETIVKRDAELESKKARILVIENKVKFPAISLTEAIAMIQRNERGRQGRSKAKRLQEVRSQESKEVDMEGLQDERQMINAVIKIQKLWRAFKARKYAATLRFQELEFLGMESTRVRVQRNALAENLRRRKELQLQHEEEYQEALVTVLEKIRKIEGPDMKETYQDTFRQWYIDFKRQNAAFPDFPAEEVWKKPGYQFGRTEPEAESKPAAATDAKSSPAAQAAAAPKSPQSAKKGSAGKTRAGSAKADPKSAGKKAPDAEESAANEKFRLDPEMPARQLLLNANKKYIDEWKEKNEDENFFQKHDVEIIRKARRLDVDEEVKNELFPILNQELAGLRATMDRENKKKKKEAKKKKKEKKAGGKKGKKEKDLTGGRPIEELVDELVEAGLMVRSQGCRISDFIAEPNYMTPPRTKIASEQSLTDIKRAITEFCILPLGLDCSEEQRIGVVKSTLLYGPPGVGKSMLVNVIATEAGASVFQLTPRVTAGQYVGKANVSRMVYTVFKVAKAYSPSIVLIDDAESVFCKRVPKEDTSDPKRIKKDILKAIRSLSLSDRVVVVGLSRSPMTAELKGLVDAFQKLILVPRPSYSTRSQMWHVWIKERIAANVGISDHIEYSVLARQSAGLPGAAIRAIVERTLTPRRLKQISKPLTTNEFLRHILALPEPDRRVEQDFVEFAARLPQARQREIVLGLAPDAAAGDKSAAAGGAKKGAKKK